MRPAVVPLGASLAALVAGLTTLAAAGVLAIRPGTPVGGLEVLSRAGDR